MLSRVASLLFAAVLLLGLVIALDPQARARAEIIIRDLNPAWQDTDLDEAPSVSQNDETYVPTPTPIATPVPYIQNTDTEDSSDEPIIVVNWDALGDSLRKFWDRLKNIRITTDIQKDYK